MMLCLDVEFGEEVVSWRRWCCMVMGTDGYNEQELPTKRVIFSDANTSDTS